MRSLPLAVKIADMVAAAHKRQARLDVEEKADEDLGPVSPFTTNSEASRRLELAADLLENGDVERALQFADPVLGQVTIGSLNFLSSLRDHDAGAADQRYSALLATAEAAPSTSGE